MYGSPRKQPILALMKSPDRLSQELEWRKHANTVCCGTERVGLAWIVNYQSCGFVFSQGPLMIVLSSRFKKRFDLAVPY